MQGEGRGTELALSDGGKGSRTAQPSSTLHSSIHRQSSRDEGNAREVYGEYIIKNAKEESTEYTNKIEFNCKVNVTLQFVEQLHVESTSKVNNPKAEPNVNFEGAPHKADWNNGNIDGASEKTAVGIDLGTTYSCVSMRSLIQKEMNAFWSWYVQGYAGQLAAVLYVGVLVGFITTIIWQIIKGITATNISNDYFMKEELDAALGFNKALQEFSCDIMKFFRFVTKFKENWTMKAPRKRTLYPATWRAGSRRRPSRRTRRMQARARRIAATRHLQCAQTVFAKTTDSTVEVIKIIHILSRKARNKLIHSLNGNML